MLRPSSLKRVPRSIFFKMLMIFVGTSVLLIAVLIGMIDHFSHIHDRVWVVRNRNRINYANLLIDQIGTPPDLKKAQKIADDIGVMIRINGEGVDYSSAPGIPPMIELDRYAHQCVWDERARVGIDGGRVYTGTVRGSYHYVFSYENESIWQERPYWGLLFISLVLFVLFLNYLIIRYLFQPLRWLSEGVARVQRGQLDEPIRTRDHDELGDLTKSFNRMTNQVSVMLKSKEQLLLDVSHELRSPITRIKVALELDEDQFKDQIKRNVRTLEVMISELLESSRLDTPRGGLNLESTKLAPFLQRVLAPFENEKPGVILSVIPDDLTAILDPTRVETVVRNILENALKYSFHQSKPVEVNAFSKDEKVHITIRDYGLGIPEEERELVFEPFYRIDKSRVRETGGYGLGLALCKKIMTAHQGSIEVLSTPDEGTVFTLVFK